MNGERTIIAATDLEYAYPGPVRALAGVSCEIRANELVFVIGPNGSGKSTLLRCLAGILAPDAGSVTLEGRALVQFTSRERATRVALVPQFLPRLPEVLVCDFVANGRYARIARGKSPNSEDRRVVQASLLACDAGDLACRGLDELSGGQRQRVLVARALAQEAQVLLVDEPTNALDPEHQIQVLDLVARSRDAERAAVVVTHDLNLASQYATSLVLMQAGRIVARGTPREVLVRDVLEPVYGTKLWYGAWTDARGEARPYVLPRRTSGGV